MTEAATESSPPPRRGRPAVFLDRDGTLIVERDWVRTPADVELVPDGPTAVRRLNEAGYAVVVVTNQSAVARGLIDEARLATIHAHLIAELARHGAHVDHVAYCPHHPTEGRPPYNVDCACRKPRPGMIVQSAAALGLDVSASWVVGDAARDLDAGRAVGVRGVLVATGKGTQELERLRAAGTPPDAFVPTLDDAVTHVLDARSGSPAQRL